MIEFTARYFAGDRPRAEDVVVRVDEKRKQLTITGTCFIQSFPLERLRMESRLGDTPRILELPAGGRLESSDHRVLSQLEDTLGDRGGWLHALESQRGPVILSLASVMLMLAGVIWQGLPALAWAASELIPPSYDQQIGRAALTFLDREWLSPSALPEEETARIRGLFDEVVAYSGQSRSMGLLFRAGHPAHEQEGIGANALALPSGIVVITDELVTLAVSEDELVGVLAHEVGHVVHRHSLRRVIQSAGITVLVWVLTGDAAGMNVLVESAPAVLANAAYSRRFEAAADDFASAYLRTTGRDPRALGTLLLRLEALTGGAGTGYLATHPPAARRAERSLELAPREAP
ncbi:MAG: M48 family metallopeptidase [Pseudomonadota bacterium]